MLRKVLQKSKSNTSYRAFGRVPDIGGATHWSYTPTAPSPSDTTSLSWVSERLPFSVGMVFASRKLFPLSEIATTSGLCWARRKKKMKIQWKVFRLQKWKEYSKDAHSSWLYIQSILFLSLLSFIQEKTCMNQLVLTFMKGEKKQNMQNEDTERKTFFDTISHTRYVEV